MQRIHSLSALYRRAGPATDRIMIVLGVCAYQLNKSDVTQPTQMFTSSRPPEGAKPGRARIAIRRESARMCR